MSYPENLLYTAANEWLQLEDGDEGVVGITEYAQDSLGDIVYLELPEAGMTVAQGDPFGVIESVKAACDLFAPASGEVLARNEALADAPELVNTSPYRDGWMIRIRLADRSELATLMDAAAYRDIVSDGT